MRSIRERSKEKAQRRLSEGFYSDVTEYEHPSISRKNTALTPIPGTERHPAIPNKTVQFCSMINLMVKQRFALVTLPLVNGNHSQNFMVISLRAVSVDEIDCFVWINGGEQMRVRVRAWQRFNIFRGA